MKDVRNEFKRIERSAVSDIVLEQVKNLIFNQKFVSGDKLPPERTLAEILGVSRPSVREALKILEALGIVEIRHGSGTYLKEPNFNFAELPMTVFLSREKEVIHELIEAREVVEVQIVTLAIKRAGDEDIARLEKFLEKRRHPEEISRLEGEYNYDFEALIGEIARNRILLSLQKATHTFWEISLKKIGFKPIPASIVNEEHIKIFNAIRSRDEAAAKEAMIYHLQAPLRILTKRNEI